MPPMALMLTLCSCKSIFPLHDRLKETKNEWTSGECVWSRLENLEEQRSDGKETEIKALRPC